MRAKAEVVHCWMILQMHFACQGSVAPRRGTYDRLIFWTMVEVFPMEVLFQVAVATERPQALHCGAGSSLSPRQKNTLGGVAIMREGFGKSWPACPLGQAWCPTRSDGAFATAGTPAFLHAAKRSHGTDGLRPPFVLLVRRWSGGGEETSHDSDTVHEDVMLGLQYPWPSSHRRLASTKFVALIRVRRLRL